MRYVYMYACVPVSLTDAPQVIKRTLEMETLWEGSEFPRDGKAVYACTCVVIYTMYARICQYAYVCMYMHVDIRRNY